MTSSEDVQSLQEWLASASSPKIESSHVFAETLACRSCAELKMPSRRSSSAARVRDCRKNVFYLAKL